MIEEWRDMRPLCSSQVWTQRRADVGTSEREKGSVLN
jgi:hypothetical protein